MTIKIINDNILPKKGGFYHDRTRKKTLYACVNALMLLLNADAKDQEHAAQNYEAPKQQNYASGLIQIDSEAETREEAPFYSQEEIKRMPLLKDGHFRKTPDGYWQVRYRKGGYDIQFTSKYKKVVVERFREWVESVNNDQKTNRLPQKKAMTFGEFAENYFKNVKAVNVKPVTLDMQMRCMKKHILPTLGNLQIRSITPMKCQLFLNSLLERNLGRTAEEARILLKEIFRAAIGEKLITGNPMDFVKIPKHHSVHGKALTKEEIAQFISICENSFYRKQFMLFLYTGIRRGELQSVQFENGFVIVANGKTRKSDKQLYRKIPIAPNLRQYLPISQEELSKCGKVITGVFKKIFPSHQLYDLRHTFTTRCLESGIPKEVVDVWTGHVNRSDMTTAVYMHFSDEFMLKEIEKLDY